MNLLTPREIEVIELIMQGYESKEVGVALEISKRTVDFHLANVMDKLRANNRVTMILAYQRWIALNRAIK